MDFLPSGVSLVLYAVTAVCGAGLLTVWFMSNRTRRNAGFAAKRHLKRHLSAKAVLKASEIRPSLTRGDNDTARASAVSLAKNHSARF
ncbi:hypothetical protein [Streptomyces sp. NPDC058280]|uniref:hypothetical protein n=1 Tax=Streptomyces sp. NPDC058280 TaxID=3346419 RepID=UPI0036EF5A4D